MQTAVSDDGRVMASQEGLDPTTPRAGLTVAANPRLRNLSLAGVVGAWRDQAEPGRPTPPGEEAFPSVVARNLRVSPRGPQSQKIPLYSPGRQSPRGDSQTDWPAALARDPYPSTPPLPSLASHLLTRQNAGFRDRNQPGRGDGARLAFPPSAAPGQVPGDTGT